LIAVSSPQRISNNDLVYNSATGVYDACSYKLRYIYSNFAAGSKLYLRFNTLDSITANVNSGKSFSDTTTIISADI